MKPSKVEVAIFLEYLQRSTEPLQNAIKGRFEFTNYPLDFAYGVIVGAGVTRCECGKWGDVDELTEDGRPLPCPHMPIDEFEMEGE